MGERNSKEIFEFVAAEMDGCKWKFEFEWMFWTFSKIEIWTLVKDLDQMNLNLKFGIFSKYSFEIRFKDVNQGIWKFEETNLNSDSEFGFDGKEFWHPFGYRDWTWHKNEI
jgi:hypothetical protein